MNKVNIGNKFKLFDEYWTPTILGEVNNCHVKVFKAKGEFEWHHHANEDEFFIVPRGIEHCPCAEQECHVLLFEPKQVVNTGDATSDKTVDSPEWI